MRVLVLVPVLLAFGCSPTSSRPPYLVHVPPGPAGPVPLVVVLHGGGGNGAQVSARTGFDAVADREGFVVAYPDGSGRTRLLTWNAGTCCGYARQSRVDHVGFIRLMLDEILACTRCSR